MPAPRITNVIPIEMMPMMLDCWRRLNRFRVDRNAGEMNEARTRLSRKMTTSGRENTGRRTVRTSDIFPSRPGIACSVAVMRKPSPLSDP